MILDDMIVELASHYVTEAFEIAFGFTEGPSYRTFHAYLQPKLIEMLSHKGKRELERLYKEMQNAPSTPAT